MDECESGHKLQEGAVREVFLVQGQRVVVFGDSRDEHVTNNSRKRKACKRSNFFLGTVDNDRARQIAGRSAKNT